MSVRAGRSSGDALDLRSEAFGSNLGQDTIYPDWGFHGFLQTLQENTSIRLRLLPSKSFLIHQQPCHSTLYEYNLCPDTTNLWGPRVPWHGVHLCTHSLNGFHAPSLLSQRHSSYRTAQCLVRSYGGHLTEKSFRGTLLYFGFGPVVSTSALRKNPGVQW
jgi:hypothetical protein